MFFCIKKFNAQFYGKSHFLGLMSSTCYVHVVMSTTSVQQRPVVADLCKCRGFQLVEVPQHSALHVGVPSNSEVRNAKQGTAEWISLWRLRGHSTPTERTGDSITPRQPCRTLVSSQLESTTRSHSTKIAKQLCLRILALIHRQVLTVFASESERYIPVLRLLDKLFAGIHFLD